MFQRRTLENIAALPPTVTAPSITPSEWLLKVKTIVPSVIWISILNHIYLHYQYSYELVFIPAAPYWISAPRNLVLAPVETGVITCRAGGHPKPTISWSMNGVSIESEISSPHQNHYKIFKCTVNLLLTHYISLFLVTDAPKDPSRTVEDDTIIFSEVQTGSSAVYQCNASNEYGYLMSNAFINVLGE